MTLLCKFFTHWKLSAFAVKSKVINISASYASQKRLSLFLQKAPVFRGTRATVSQDKQAGFCRNCTSSPLWICIISAASFFSLLHFFHSVMLRLELFGDGANCKLVRSRYFCLSVIARSGRFPFTSENFGLFKTLLVGFSYE